MDARDSSEQAQTGRSLFPKLEQFRCIIAVFENQFAHPLSLRVLEVTLMKKVLHGCIITALFALFVASTVAQLPARAPSPTPAPAGEQPPVCSAITIQPQPGGMVKEGQRIYFTVSYQTTDVRGGSTIIWNTSSGSIVRGQGTSRIEVDSTGAGATAEREIKADVWINGSTPDCVMQATAAVKVIAPAAKFGEFGEVDNEVFARNIKSLAEFMSQSQDYLYVIAYAGRNSERGFTQNWVKRIKAGLSQAGVADSKVYAVDGGFREQPVFDFWIVPIGADPPRPEPTIKRNEIVYPKAAPVKKP